MFINDFQINFNTYYNNLDFKETLTAYKYVKDLGITKIDLQNLYKRKIEVTDFYPFVNNQVSKIILKDSKKWCSFGVEGFSGNSDYEPYTLGYKLTYLKFDWLEFLYPIRNSLVLVKEAANQLENLKIQLKDWKVDYDISSYDAYFNHIELDSSCIDDINEVIKKNLK